MKRRRSHKRETPKQQAARKRNFAIFRLRGISVVLEDIVRDNSLLAITNYYLVDSSKLVDAALASETGK